LRAGFGPSSNASRSDKRRRQQARAGPSPDACCCRSYTFCNAEQWRHGEADRPCAMAVLISPKRLPATRCPPRGKLSLMPIAEALLTDDIVVTASSADGLGSSIRMLSGADPLPGLALHPAGSKNSSSACRMRRQQRNAQLAASAGMVSRGVSSSSHLRYRARRARHRIRQEGTMSALASRDAGRRGSGAHPNGTVTR